MFEGRYTDWTRITYEPAIERHLPEDLLDFLPSQASVLDIGCYDGAVCAYLAEEGFSVSGVDINPNAIEKARDEAKARGLDGRLTYRVADALYEPLDQHDAVTLIRVLACFPDADDWLRLLRRAWAAVHPGGLLYIHDFLRVPDSPVYRDRYKRAIEEGQRAGNLLVCDLKGQPLFVAHHHDSDEVDRIAEPGARELYRTHASVSMNGNPTEMFVYLGRKAKDRRDQAASACFGLH